MKFKIYVDWTTEDFPRPFYVGKGTAARLRKIARNKLHTAIADKYGLERRIVFETDDEELAFTKERELITEHNTFVYGGGWGANFTQGGEGTAGHPNPHCRGKTHPMWGRKHSEEAKRQNSEYNKIAQRGELNGMYGKKHTKETREKIGLKSAARKDSPETREKKRSAALVKPSMKGRKHTPETREKMRQARLGKPPWNKGKRKRETMQTDEPVS